MIKRRPKPALLLFLFLFLSLGFAASLNFKSLPESPPPQAPAPKPAGWNGSFAEGWQNYEQLTKEQKYEAASSLVETMLAAARAAKNNPEWTRCLIRYTQLRIALHGYETTVRFLKEQPWPGDFAGSSFTFYAQSLVTYA
jgi:hypothetical protein